MSTRFVIYDRDEIISVSGLMCMSIEYPIENQYSFQIAHNYLFIYSFTNS